MLALTVNVHGSRVAQNMLVAELALMYSKGRFIWEDMVKSVISISCHSIECTLRSMTCDSLK